MGCSQSTSCLLLALLTFDKWTNCYRCVVIYRSTVKVDVEEVGLETRSDRKQKTWCCSFSCMIPQKLFAISVLLQDGPKLSLDRKYHHRPALGASKTALGAYKGNGDTPLGLKQRIHPMYLTSNVSSELSKLFCNNLQNLYKIGLV